MPMGAASKETEREIQVEQSRTLISCVACHSLLSASQNSPSTHRTTLMWSNRHEMFG